MSDTDSFIEEVTEEVRRDRLYGYVRKYGWVAALVVVLIVGGAAFAEYRKAQAAERAEALGDNILAAYAATDQSVRTEMLTEINAESPSARAALDMITAAELAENDQPKDAADRLNQLAQNGDVPEVYRQIAGFKALLVQSETLDAAARISGFESFAVAGHPLRLLAEEQLALISAELDDTDTAIAQLQSIMTDAEATQGLQQRAMQVIVALGGEPDLSALQNAQTQVQN